MCAAVSGCLPAECRQLGRLDDHGHWAGLEGAAWAGAVHPKSGQPATPFGGHGPLPHVEGDQGSELGVTSLLPPPPS